MPRWDFLRAEEKALKELGRARTAANELASLYVETIEAKGAQALPDTLQSCRLVLLALEAVGQEDAAKIARERIGLLEALEATLQARRERAAAACDHRWAESRNTPPYEDQVYWVCRAGCGRQVSEDPTVRCPDCGVRERDSQSGQQLHIYDCPMAANPDAVDRRRRVEKYGTDHLCDNCTWLGSRYTPETCPEREDK